MVEEVMAREATFKPKEPTTESVGETVRLEVTGVLPTEPEPLGTVASELPVSEP